MLLNEFSKILLNTQLLHILLYACNLKLTPIVLEIFPTNTYYNILIYITIENYSKYIVFKNNDDYVRSRYIHNSNK